MVFGFKYSPRPNTPAIKLEDAIPDEEKAKRLNVLLERQREIQRGLYARHLNQTLEVMVEGRNEARAQWMGRTSQNKTLNFTAPSDVKIGSYVQALVTKTLPNSLVGELCVGKLRAPENPYGS